jgi:ribosome biogenesis protein ENP2
VSSGKSVGEFFSESKQKKIKLKKNEEYRNRLELIEDFEFTGSGTHISITEDNNYITAAGRSI